MAHCVRWGSWFKGKGRFGGQTPSQNMRLLIAVKSSVLCCHLANTNEELGGFLTLIPPFTLVLVIFNMPTSRTSCSSVQWLFHVVVMITRKWSPNLLIWRIDVQNWTSTGLKLAALSVSCFIITMMLDWLLALMKLHRVPKKLVHQLILIT